MQTKFNLKKNFSEKLAVINSYNNWKHIYKEYNAEITEKPLVLWHPKRYFKSD